MSPVFRRTFERLPASDLAQARRARLQTVIARAQETEYYRSVLGAAAVTEPHEFEPHHLARLPMVDRHIMASVGLRAFLRTDPAGLISVTTSGSTGTPGRFYRSWREEADNSARWMRVYRAYGCGFRDRQVNIATAGKPDRQGPVTWLRRAGILPKVVRLRSDSAPADLLAEIRAIKPPILTGYAGAIEAVADHIIETGAPVPSPRAVFCTAMEVTERCLALAERAFRAPSVDVYVTNEFGVIAWSCPARRDVLHLNEDAFIVEAVDASGRAVAPGVVGELVITSLTLTTMPLIRYRMGDMAALLADPCECGRSFGLMSRVQGRTAHVIRRRNGAAITTPNITRLVGQASAYEWVRQYQVREEPGFRLRILLQVRHSPTEAQHRTLVETMRRALGPDFQLAFEQVEQIPLAPSGKLQYLVPLASVTKPAAVLAS